MKRDRGSRPRLKNAETRTFVERHLQEGWSPEIIAGRLRATAEKTTVCHEAIYQYIYKERIELIRYLARHHHKRKAKYPQRKKPVEPVPLKTPISERPARINDRSTYGHWESDSIVDRTHTGINVIVERKTRLAHITKLTDSSSETTAHALIQRLGQHPAAFVRSITYDNGPENARHLLVNSTLGCTSYFCEPYHSWEKGLVENTNEKIRRYIPKKTEFSTIDQDQLTAIEVALNNRPKRCLGYRTPSEAYHDWIASRPSPDEVKDNTVAVTH